MGKNSKNTKKTAEIVAQAECIQDSSSDKKVVDILIVGGGPAGLTAAVYAARAGFKTVILEKLITGGQISGTEDIENFPGFTKIGGAELAMKMTEQAEYCGAEIVYDEIESIDLAAKTIKCASTEISCKAMIICTGAGPRKVGAENEEKFAGAGVHYCAICDGAFYKGKTVVIVGGGNSAVEEAIYLSGIAAHVHIINNTATFNAQKVTVDRLTECKNITIHQHCIVKKINGEKIIESISIFDTVNQEELTIKCDGVFVAIGRVPNTDIFKGKIETTPAGYIIADGKLQTTVDGVFAAGDVINKSVRQVITACADGAIAATNAAEYIRLKK